MKKNNQILLSIIGVAILIVAVVGVTFAFFNYTRTGSENTLSVGRISFNHTQDGKIELSNVFPANKNNLNSTNSDTVTINITGDTDYSEGIEYKVTLEDVNNTINGKEVPISIKATATNLGTVDSNYYTNRTNKEKIYLLNEEGEAYNGKYIAVGYIPSGSAGVNGSIDITAFIDTNKVAISDTYNGNETDLMGTTNDWVMGREVFTSSEWNSITGNNALSFKVKVEAQEGIWVEKEKFLTMKNLSKDSNWTAIRASITSIEFHKDGVVPINYVTSFDVTDTTSNPDKGNITLYTVDDGLGNNTYKAIVVANDTIYAPENSSQLFYNMLNLVTFNSKNFKVDNTAVMSWMFNACQNLANIKSLSIWNVYNVNDFYQMFAGCTSLSDISALATWNIGNVDRLGMFTNCPSLVDISPLKNWDVQNVNSINQMFSGCSNLSDISALKNWNVINIDNMQSAFSNTKISNLNDLSGWNVLNVTKFGIMFSSCSYITDASGINNWNISASANFRNMFGGTTPSHPEFTKFPNGTWSNGTFSPNA